MTTRRLFVHLLPLGGAAWLAACSDKAPAPPPATPSPAPAPPAVAPAPTATAPEPVPSSPAPAPAATPTAAAPTPTATGPVSETEPVAISLGYVADASRADAAKFKTYVAGQACSNCALYTGKAGEASGPCPIFGGRVVPAKAWCSAYVKKAG
jgi:High potential iron-sulfur protein